MKEKEPSVTKKIISAAEAVSHVSAEVQCASPPIASFHAIGAISVGVTQRTTLQRLLQPRDRLRTTEIHLDHFWFAGEELEVVVAAAVGNSVELKGQSMLESGSREGNPRTSRGHECHGCLHPHLGQRNETRRSKEDRILADAAPVDIQRETQVNAIARVLREAK